MYEIECPDGEVVKPKEGYIYRFIRKTYEKALEDDLVVFKKTTRGPLITIDGEQSNWNIYIKKHLGDSKGAPVSLLPRDKVGLYNKGTSKVQDLFDGQRVFENVKSVELIEYLIEIFSPNHGDIVLDFFSGSATTANAVLSLNSENAKQRKFILVQLPEKTDPTTVAFKNGYENISDIGKERIRRVIKSILKEDSERVLSHLDMGFKVLKLDQTNIKPWDADSENLEEILKQSIDSIKLGRSAEDVLYEILLKYGIELTVPVETEIVEGKKVFVVGAGALIVCLDDEITSEVVEGIARLKDELDPETTQVVFKDAGFADSNVKTNAIQILKQAGIDDVKSI